MRNNASTSVALVLFLFSFAFLSLPPRIQCADSTFAPSFYTEEIYKELQNLATLLNRDIKTSLGFCIKDVKKDWVEAFDFEEKLDFVDSCVKKKGDFRDRICTATEIRYYFHGFLEQGASSSNYVKPNKNCNLTSWVSGCEPGWGCSAGKSIDLKKDIKEIPYRTDNCQPCCEGFFCPQGLTCMIPCPLGSYCPLAKLNNETGICDPYSYQIPQGETNHTCGSADIWSGMVNNSDIFCSPGSYCPTTTRKVSCDSGYYCRMGSTHQNPCSKLSTCNPSTANQNMHAYGALLIVALSTILIIIYNCSDQVLATRERRKAKSREAAARQVRETVQARERWKIAKDIAKKGKPGLQEQLSRTFSRRKSVKQAEQSKVFSQAKPAMGSTLLPPVPPGSSSTSQESSAASKAPNNEPSNLTKMLNSFENDPNSNEGFNLQIGDKNIKKQMPKGKQLHTQSQILRYAYGQIEKEKAQQEKNKNLTFSGVISMATEGDVRTRPVIEVAFKDLTLTLSGKRKHLLRCVTGKIMPGRVSAVMGPSGAGKTTFLSALAGKARGCTMTGSILINGKPDSIHCYQKIIGFVPQDDIVHGNLTVEENLRFSARCRLSADMPKPDKVLIVERVIESLGLQAVRDSLVGTVEKRGISGGQRKRVNVGLEMVMEPSLLILDEPTTGLDSASSTLLLKALRREALEGVNICMVLHQPSYTLFKMFDDIIFLAKGGLTAYHGPVKKVEEYFAGIGIPVPDRVNPPDHFIDILEGLVKPSSGVTYQQLPVRWMLHNSYPVPPDMLHYIDQIAASSSSSNINDATTKGTEEAADRSFAGEFWEDMKSNVQSQRDHIEATFLKTKDLSNRTTPGVSWQYRYYLGRIGKQQLREAKSQAVDYLLLLVAGAILGTLTKVNDETFGSLGYTYTVIAVSLLCKIAALRSFSLDKLQYWRESASGISSLAHFLAKDTIDLFNTIIKPVVYLSMFYFFSNPRSSFGSNYVVLLCLVYCVTGMAYALAIYFEPAPAQLGSVLLPVVMTLIANQKRDTTLMKILVKLCYPNWALEAFIIANAERYTGVWLITRCSSLMNNGYDVSDWPICLIVLILYGIIARVVAYFCLVITLKK
ncbi:putative white-brown complex homolog protein 30 [Gastrolobium bilobum]|uniref:putative white-brown complex homolog protein 30 n=1 Tax=Gastrolobium bilobum TaxID=150636 RepID=UPI002AAF5DB4|nr:putative white-brown complex homolog protein 30 [Gastrolobium bilobum]